MVDSEHNMIIYKSIKISVGAVMNNLEILKFVPQHLKTKKIRVVDNYPQALKFVPDCYMSKNV